MIGGTGHFGGRICRRIVGEENTELIVTSRSEPKAQALVDELQQTGAGAPIDSARLDQDSPEFERDLAALQADIVIHTAGPYQGQDYRVARACISSGCHYIDLADGRDFVQGFRVLHEEAKLEGVSLISGASTLPGLSSVVVDSLRHRFAAIREIEISIAPAHRTPRGQSTVAAVLSYCGMPFQALVAGTWVTMHGWQDMRTQRYPDLGLRLSAVCDVPDLALLPEYVAGVDTVTFRAALEATWEQIALWLMAWMTRSGVVKSWNRFVPSFQRMSERLINLGSDVGGMRIKLTGASPDKKPLSVTWNLTARQNHGPEIPCTPALIIARKLAADKITARGALPCLGMFSMTEFEDEISGLDIGWRVDENS